MTDLKIAAISLDIQYGEVKKNVKNAVEIINGLPEDVDAVVLPELFNTSFVCEQELLRKIAEDDDGPTMNAMREAARKRDCLISGSFSGVKDGKFYNRGFMVLPDGTTSYYNKRHLFSVSDESKVFTAGGAFMPVVNFRGWNISMMICYDLRFPVWSRNVRHRYDILLVPANWPQSRGYAWTHLLIARAIENQAIVVGANRGGRDEYGEYDGMTQIYDALGMPIGLNKEGGLVVEGTASAEDLETARRRLPAHFDADDFEIPLS